ncbi:glutathione S-transferase [Siccirubricoccus deserti]|uniref:Glutathione S-transferase n=1 Tax=Siccirubricoccus deserti TaxID=2013562 RepID=A0A9X0UEU5_9PROT|nr:glutathione S-transferase [Siccirubricoccus deserti]MBC4018027.1 glutathione S-transferase [Siccirubricoccus deserti]GGC62400.1 glutathione S-transferase [Siccirubricoccus deserti]
MLKLWGRASSSNVMKVLWLCEELSIPHERIDAGGEYGRTEEPFYLAMNPNSRVPTIEEPDGYSLWESNSILRYLVATRAPGDPVHPAAPKLRADVERWMDWQLATLSGPMTAIYFAYVRTPEAQRDMVATAKARGEAETLWAIVDRQLQGRQYVAGGFSLADIVLGPYIHRWFALPIERPPMPNLEGWYARLLAEHPGFGKHVAVPLA